MTGRVAFFLVALIAGPGAPSRAAERGPTPAIPVHVLTAAPTVDGDAAEWSSLPAVRVPLHRSHPAITSVLVTAGRHDGRVFLLARWRDGTEDRVHKPWVWDLDTGRYVTGPEREDRFALQFAMAGDYDTNWASGRTFVADMWHWKASRSDPHGLAHDKLTRITREKQLRSAKIRDPLGGTLYVARPSDGGGSLYTTARYGRRQAPVMPKYLLARSVTGSVADVSARGVWRDGTWTLELSRALDTGHDDDVRFRSGTPVLGGIAIFDHSENDDHAVSPVVTFRF